MSACGGFMIIVVALWFRLFVFFVFFKQETAYDMRISDWSSDVCSSDLLRQTMDVCLGDVHHFIELLAGPYALRAVSLSHTPIAPLSVYNRFFGAPVHPAQRHSGMHLARETFEMRSEEHTSELQSLMRISYAVFCLKTKINYSYNEELYILLQNFLIYIYHY